MSQVPSVFTPDVVSGTVQEGANAVASNFQQLAERSQKAALQKAQINAEAKLQSERLDAEKKAADQQLQAAQEARQSSQNFTASENAKERAAQADIEAKRMAEQQKRDEADIKARDRAFEFQKTAYITGLKLDAEQTRLHAELARLSGEQAQKAQGELEKVQKDRKANEDATIVAEFHAKVAHSNETLSFQQIQDHLEGLSAANMAAGKKAAELFPQAVKNVLAREAVALKPSLLGAAIHHPLTPLNELTMVADTPENRTNATGLPVTGAIAATLGLNVAVAGSDGAVDDPKDERTIKIGDPSNYAPALLDHAVTEYSTSLAGVEGMNGVTSSELKAIFGNLVGKAYSLNEVNKMPEGPAKQALQKDVMERTNRDLQAAYAKVPPSVIQGLADGLSAIQNKMAEDLAAYKAAGLSNEEIAKRQGMFDAVRQTGEQFKSVLNQPANKKAWYADDYTKLLPGYLAAMKSAQTPEQFDATVAKMQLSKEQADKIVSMYHAGMQGERPSVALEQELLALSKKRGDIEGMAQNIQERAKIEASLKGSQATQESSLKTLDILKNSGL